MIYHFILKLLRASIIVIPACFWQESNQHIISNLKFDISRKS